MTRAPSRQPAASAPRPHRKGDTCRTRAPSRQPPVSARRPHRKGDTYRTRAPSRQHPQRGRTSRWIRQGYGLRHGRLLPPHRGSTERGYLQDTGPVTAAFALRPHEKGATCRVRAPSLPPLRRDRREIVIDARNMNKT